MGQVTTPRIIGRYALYDEIASGGMATVHVGRLLGPAGFARTVALKRLHPQFAKDPEFVSMFLDEARLAARIQHPNVVDTLDVVAAEGELFLVMAYVEGETLARLIRMLKKGGKRFPPRTASTILCDVLHGLHAAHEAKDERGVHLGLVHRDVSPQNVLIGVDGVTRVLDFGVAKAAGRIQVTHDGQVKGKLAYMPPEQIGCATVDRRVDVYAAAVVLWETLTGQRLFDGDSPTAIVGQILAGEILPPSSVAPEVPAALDKVVMRGLARDPQKRYASGNDFAEAIEDAIGLESSRRVSDFVQKLAKEVIESRHNLIREVESASRNLPVPVTRDSIAVGNATAGVPSANRPLRGDAAGEAMLASAMVAADDALIEDDVQPFPDDDGNTGRFPDDEAKTFVIPHPNPSAPSASSGTELMDVGQFTPAPAAPPRAPPPPHSDPGRSEPNAMARLAFEPQASGVSPSEPMPRPDEFSSRTASVYNALDLHPPPQEKPRRQLVAVLGGLAGALMLFVGIVVFVSGRGSAKPTVTVTGSPAQEPAALLPKPTPTLPSETMPTTAASGRVSASADTNTKPKATAEVSSKPVAKTSPTSQAAAPTNTKSCSPPTTTDAKGIMRLKPWCIK